VWLLTGPAFRVREVTVLGAQRTNQQQLVAAAGLDRPTSIFTVQGDQVQARLGRLAWVRKAETHLELPGRVVVRLSEWQPAAVYRPGPAGPPMLVNDDGVVIAAASSQDKQVEIVGPANRGRSVGDKSLDPGLLAALVSIQRGFPETVQGEAVRSYELDACGNLVLLTARGWKVYFGRVLTPAELALLGDKLSALKSLSVAARGDLSAPDLEYVNVMNPSLPAVHRRSDRPPPSPAPPAGQPAPKPTAPVAVPSIQVQPCQ
jgi:hypothetical protein